MNISYNGTLVIIIKTRKENNYIITRNFKMRQERYIKLCGYICSRLFIYVSF